VLWRSGNAWNSAGRPVKKVRDQQGPPSLFKDGRFLREDWTACTDIGRTTPSGTLDKQEYLRVEELYVAAVAVLARTVEPIQLQVHDVEFWETASDRLANLALADVLDGAVAPAEGEAVAGARLDNLVRRCLREVAWLELMVAPTLLVHFGYDMLLVVASSIPLDWALGQMQVSGLLCMTAISHYLRSARGSTDEQLPHVASSPGGPSDPADHCSWT
jgi:hypothetical protein